MKSMINRSLFVATIASSLVMVSCGSSKKKNQASEEQVSAEIGKILTGIPCEKQGVSNNRFFRASSMANSSDLQLSKEKALLLAKQRISTLISSKIKSVTDRYVNETEDLNNSDFEQKFENLTREVVNLQLTDITVTCSESSIMPDNSYRSFIAVEISKDDFYDKMNQNIEQRKIQVDYDKMKFEQIYKEEMEKLEQ